MIKTVLELLFLCMKETQEKETQEKEKETQRRHRRRRHRGDTVETQWRVLTCNAVNCLKNALGDVSSSFRCS